MEAGGASDNSDYELDLDSSSLGGPHGKGRAIKKSSRRGKDIEEDEDLSEEHDNDSRSGLKGQITKGVANYVWEESRTRARKAFSLYGNIDILRPYYDVEPHEVRSRLVMSLFPKLPNAESRSETSLPHELYGPTMLVFTLIAMLLFEMKSSGHVVQEGTLMGTAFVTCFGYWLGVSAILWLTTYLCNTHITMLQILHILGYALFGHCVVVLLTTIFHPYHSHMFFYAMWLIFGGLSTLRLVNVLISRTPGRSQQMVVAAVVISAHLLFLLYLHFAYHHVVEELSVAIDSVHPSILQASGSDGTGKLQGVHFGNIEDDITTTTQAFTKFARRSFERKLRGDLNVALAPRNIVAINNGTGLQQRGGTRGVDPPQQILAVALHNVTQAAQKLMAKQW